MKLTKMSSSIRFSGILTAGAALFLAGCNPPVKIGSDIGLDALEIATGDTSAPNGESAASGTIACHVKIESAEGSSSYLELSNQDLTVNGGDGTGLIIPSVARASASHITGKWYFEIHIDQLFFPNLQEVGVAVRAPYSNLYKEAIYHCFGSSYSLHGNGSSSNDVFDTGDLIGVALDLDAGRVYFHKNGAWQNGDPASGTGGLEIRHEFGTSGFYPFLDVAMNDQLTANFGESTFAYSEPAGFLPYAQGFVADSAGDCVDDGAPTPTPTTPNAANCPDLSSYYAGSAGGTELHVITAYESKDPDGGITVNVSRTVPLVLVLASYGSVKWNLLAKDDTSIQRIILSSYEPSIVETQQTVPIESFIFERDGTYLDIGVTWPPSPGNGTQALVDNAEAETGLTLTSFTGCSVAGVYALPDS